MKFLDIRMVIGTVQHAGDDPALFCHAHATLGTPVFKGFLLVHRLPHRLMHIAFQPTD